MIQEDLAKEKQEKYAKAQEDLESRVKLFKIDKELPKTLRTKKTDHPKELEPYIPTTLNLEKD